MYKMPDAVIDRNLPKQLPSFFLRYFTGGQTPAGHDHEVTLALRAFQPIINRLCLLLTNVSSSLVARRVKGAVMEL